MNIKLAKIKFLTFALVISWAVSACSKNPKSQEKILDITPITVTIPSQIANEVLAITLPRCALDLKESPNNGNITANKAILMYDVYAYSGNLNNRFECEKTNPTGIQERNMLQPVYPLADGQPINSGYDYLVKSGTALGKRIIEEKPFVQKRNVNTSQEMLLVNGMPKQSTPFELTYFKYDGSINAPSSYNYRVLTIIQDKYYFEYEMTILVPENRHGHNLPEYNTDFAEKFRDVIQSKGNVLDHPELIQGFVDNNERVVKFINEHTVITKKRD